MGLIEPKLISRELFNQEWGPNELQTQNSCNERLVAGTGVKLQAGAYPVVNVSLKARFTLRSI